MFEIKGKVNTAVCYAAVVEEEAIEQIRRMCDYEFTEGSKIRIMPDVHAGKGCTLMASKILLSASIRIFLEEKPMPPACRHGQMFFALAVSKEQRLRRALSTVSSLRIVPSQIKNI